MLTGFQLVTEGGTWWTHGRVTPLQEVAGQSH